MKTHISRKAIELVAVEYAIAKRSAIIAASYSNEEYFNGKAYSIMETFAQLSGQSWTNAQDMLSEVWRSINPDAS